MRILITGGAGFIGSNLALQYVLNHVTNPVVLVTSSFSGEGKSFISTNVGAVIALTGKKNGYTRI